MGTPPSMRAYAGGSVPRRCGTLGALYAAMCASPAWCMVKSRESGRYSMRPGHSAFGHAR